MEHTLSSRLNTLLVQKASLVPQHVPQEIPHGDMPGDKIVIDEGRCGTDACVPGQRH